MDLIIAWISQYGYTAIFLLLVTGIVGLPIPEETMLVFSGYLIAQGHLNPVSTGIAAAAGSVCGITMSYWIGRSLGLGFVRRWGRYLHVTETRLETVHRWFERIGHWALFAGYYVAGVRHFTALVAGTTGLRYRTFAVYAYSGGLLWVALFLSIGYFFGEHWQQVAEVVHRDVLWVLAAVLVAGSGYWMWRRRRSG